MALKIETFSNQTGGVSFFKAISHPLAVPAARAMLARLASQGPVAIYDPHGAVQSIAEIHPLDGIEIAGIYVQKVEALDAPVLGRPVKPITEIGESGAKAVFIAAFDAERLVAHVRHLLPAGAALASLDDMRLPDRMLSNPARYLDPLNFATNFAFFRDEKGHHTRIVTANYWFGYGARGVRYWAQLFAADGTALAAWEEALPDSVAGVTIDSKAVRARFGLPDFAGQLFLHFIGAKGHDVVKYALDTYGDAPDVLSCTHDANAWPSDRYAGLPAPQDGEKVVLWVQNSFPRPIPRKAIGLNEMGDEDVTWLDREVPAFGSYPLDVAELLPSLRYPQQIEIQAGKHFVRPRYEIAAANGRTRIAHPNVERADLKPDPRVASLANLMGRGYILPAPLLPPDRYSTSMLPTPMATGQTELPIAVAVHDAAGKELHLHRFGNLKRRDSVWLELDSVLKANGGLPSGYGHLFLHYDFTAGTQADGWLHAIFRFADRASGHAAETSFGAHIFNTVLTFAGEPQSYVGAAPGLSTRLFLRLGTDGRETFCHLIYPASTPWHAASSTDLVLHSAAGAELARKRVQIACNGSLLWRAGEMFGKELIATAGDGGYVIIRDTTCRLFGYHGLTNGQAFSLDHMFGF
ncbi:MAG: hypothetical protein KIT16_17480 [Rhodospirillaceae bacterium]|nr:hypothetical protein [Rhodospirillaceae bacterium]